jgi:signal recognition particle GTPase
VVLGRGDVVGLIRRFEEVVGEEKAEQDALRMLEGKFDLNDYFDQIGVLQKRRRVDTQSKMAGFQNDGRDGAMRRTYTQAEVDEKSRDLIKRTLKSLIASYDGSARGAKEILRGLAAAREMDVDCRPFEDALAKRYRSRKAA